MKLAHSITSLALIMLASMIPTATLAQDAGWYVGANLGQSKFKDACSGTASCDDKDTAFNIFGGYQFSKNFGAELGYVDLGSATAPGASADAKGFEVLGVGSIPLGDRFSLYGKLGFFRWDLDATQAGFPSMSESGTDLTYAIGGKFHFTKKIAATVQWQRYADIGNDATTGKSDVDVIGIGVIFKF